MTEIQNELTQIMQTIIQQLNCYNVKTYSLQIDEDSLLHEKNELGFKVLIRVKTKNIQEGTILDGLMENMYLEKCQDLWQCNAKTKKNKRCKRMQKVLKNGFCCKHEKK